MRSLAALTGALVLVSGYTSAGVNDLVGDSGRVTILHCQTTNAVDRFDAKHASTTGFDDTFFAHVISAVGNDCAVVLDALTNSSQPVVDRILKVNSTPSGGGSQPAHTYMIMYVE